MLNFQDMTAANRRFIIKKPAGFHFTGHELVVLLTAAEWTSHKNMVVAATTA
jgi:hypothetical protein